MVTVYSQPVAVLVPYTIRPYTIYGTAYSPIRQMEQADMSTLDEGRAALPMSSSAGSSP
jgi:hypothetical protein